MRERGDDAFDCKKGRKETTWAVLVSKESQGASERKKKRLGSGSRFTSEVW